MNDVAEAIKSSLSRRRGIVGIPIKLDLRIRTCKFFDLIVYSDVKVGVFNEIKSQVYLEVWS